MGNPPRSGGESLGHILEDQTRPYSAFQHLVGKNGLLRDLNSSFERDIELVLSISDTRSVKCVRCSIDEREREFASSHGSNHYSNATRGGS